MPVYKIGIKNKETIIKNFESFLFLYANQKSKNKANFCKYDPAICSLPKKLEGLLAVISKPIRFFPKITCMIKSNEIKSDKNEAE